MDAAGSTRAILFGESDGGPLCALFAATYPDRVLGLVMHGPDVRAAWAPDAPWGMTSEDFKAEVENIEDGWGTGRFERGFIEEMAPSMVGDEDFLNWTTRYFRQSASPGAAMALNRMWYAIDIRDIISAVGVSTLILNRTSAILNPVEESRYLAERMPSAEYVELPGADHLPWVGDQEALLEHVERFVRSTRDEEAEMDRVLATVMFTDIVDSTATAVASGDAAWKALAERHHGIVRALLARYQRGRGRYGWGRVLRHVRRARQGGPLRSRDRPNSEAAGDRGARGGPHRRSRVDQRQSGRRRRRDRRPSRRHRQCL